MSASRSDALLLRKTPRRRRFFVAETVIYYYYLVLLPRWIYFFFNLSYFLTSYYFSPFRLFISPVDVIKLICLVSNQIVSTLSYTHTPGKEDDNFHPPISHSELATSDSLPQTSTANMETRRLEKSPQLDTRIVVKTAAWISSSPSPSPLSSPSMQPATTQPLIPSINSISPLQHQKQQQQSPPLPPTNDQPPTSITTNPPSPNSKPTSSTVKRPFKPIHYRSTSSITSPSPPLSPKTVPADVTTPDYLIPKYALPQISADYCSFVSRWSTSSQGSIGSDVDEGFEVLRVGRDGLLTDV